MALTTPRGFAGGPMSDFDYGQVSAAGSWVETAGAFAVTQPNTATRTVAIAAGIGAAFGVRVTNDAAISQALAAPGSGGAWYLLALRFNWSAKTVTLQVLAGATTGSTGTPSVAAATGAAGPTALPGTTASTPGTTYDMPLAWCFVNSANTTVTVLDLRVRQAVYGQALATTPDALAVLGLLTPPATGLLLGCLADAPLWRWNGAGWRRQAISEQRCETELTSGGPATTSGQSASVPVGTTQSDPTGLMSPQNTYNIRTPWRGRYRVLWRVGLAGGDSTGMALNVVNASSSTISTAFIGAMADSQPASQHDDLYLDPLTNGSDVSIYFQVASTNGNRTVYTGLSRLNPKFSVQYLGDN